MIVALPSETLTTTASSTSLPRRNRTTVPAFTEPLLESALVTSFAHFRCRRSQTEFVNASETAIFRIL